VTSPTRTSISALPRGHEFPPAVFIVTPEHAHAYLAAVGDRGSYGDATPPLAVVALGLQALQEHLSLPEGSLHTGQEVEHERAVPTGQTLTLSGRVAQRSERQGYVISVIEFEIASADGVAVRARTTIMAPGGAA
jgi:predicted thioesterase